MENIETLPPFEKFPSIPRLSRNIIITEKLDGANSGIYIDDTKIVAASRNRWITPADDNFGFAKWVEAHADALKAELGFGHHFGEWYGQGIQRGYGLKEKRFALFNTTRWMGEPLTLCSVVPTLYVGMFDTVIIDLALADLQLNGSKAVPGFAFPEGIVVFHTAANVMFKKTIGNDGAKGNNKS